MADGGTGLMFKYLVVVAALTVAAPGLAFAADLSFAGRKRP